MRVPANPWLVSLPPTPVCLRGSPTPTLPQLSPLTYSPVGGSDVYTVYRLIVPYFDRQRNVFQLKEAALAATVSAALGLDPKESLDAKKLKGWKKQEGINHQGDFSKVCEEVRWDFGWENSLTRGGFIGGRT
jgi:hypothetical protein